MALQTAVAKVTPTETAVVARSVVSRVSSGVVSMADLMVDRTD